MVRRIDEMDLFDLMTSGAALEAKGWRQETEVDSQVQDVRSAVGEETWLHKEERGLLPRTGRDDLYALHRPAKKTKKRKKER